MENTSTMKVYSYYNDEVVFEGSREECRAALMSRVRDYGGRCIFRSWFDKEKSRYVYDFESLFYTYEPLFEGEPR